MKGKRCQVGEKGYHVKGGDGGESIGQGKGKRGWGRDKWKGIELGKALLGQGYIERERG